ncbi:ligand-dependent nuclear receptor corepressor-like protein isoform X2 [Danio rerio]|uniref:Ligand-dependent nuclear receptor corepressor-like protein isoform X2 n=1 Tax=Danio rerio TaxID=7955 RepID=A0A8N7TCX7_DANRE|nr:ligand-dependent nuclear receptor corepressor-like protein isoform X1 [Danio rerio]|eukprot:XP_686735.6 ligand-dependent nuclear receptor corepressor-like protein isoform X1 [Danio rerio]
MAATQCRSSKCTAERKGFRRELDSWRHKLIQCVGFESILEGIYGPRLLQDLNIFDECEPEDLDDWSIDANCSFCNLQLEKLNEHPAVPGSPPPAETPPPQGLSTSDKVQCQADRFLYAIFRKKEFPQSCDSSIPLVAQELMRRMIRRFALEYACKSQTNGDLNGLSDNSERLLSQPDPDGPLDLTVSRASPALQVDGVLDLSKKNTPSENETTLQISSGRPISEDYLDRSSEFAEGLLSKALKDIRSGSLDINKAAILYRIPQKTLQLQTEALLPERRAGEPRENGRSTEAVWPTSDTRLVLQKVAAWARSQSEQSEVRKLKFTSLEHTELKFPAAVTASSYLHHLTLQRMVSQLREQSDGSLVTAEPATSPHSPASGPVAHIRIPQVRFSAQPKAQLDLVGLVDAVYQTNKASEGPTAFHKLKTILPKQGLVESHSGLESRLLQGDLPPLCLNIKNGSVGGSVTGSLVDCGDDDRRDKQPRKKRGRYRQYDHDILEEAIAMVIGGKMSVSKAQGVYGVPHSTLEYKVKERTGMLKTPPKKKLRLSEAAASGSGKSGTTTNASSTAYKQS